MKQVDSVKNELSDIKEERNNYKKELDQYKSDYHMKMQQVKVMEIDLENQINEFKKKQAELEEDD